MSKLPPVFISAAVEGIVDEAVFERLVRTVRAAPGPVHRTENKDRLLRRLTGFNHAAKREPWLVLVDLDRDADCAPPFRQRHLPRSERLMCFRVAVREIESWLLADRERMAALLGLSLHKMPPRPDNLDNPKQELVNLARRSPDRHVREDMVPRPGSRREVGPLYSSMLIGFVQDARGGWRPAVAARVSDSLRRCVRDLRRVVATAKRGA